MILIPEKQKMMKKNITRTFAGLLVMTAMVLPACEFLEDCGTCELVTDNGTEITYGTPLPQCGDDYYDKLNADPVTIGGVTTYWNCY